MEKTPLLLLFISLILLSNCASRKDMIRAQEEIHFLQQQVLLLKSEQERLNQALMEFKKIVEQNNETVYKYQADTKQQIRELSTQTRILHERLEESLHRISGLSDRVSISTPALNGTDTTRVLDTKSYSDAEALYQSAYQDLVKGNYELARQGFNRFLQQFPDSDLADNAQYWIGETYYAQNQYTEAARSFQTVISRYPGGDKTSAALLKLAYSQISLNQRSSARKNLEKLLREFPDSNEAGLAQSRLNELTGGN